ncbi:hypothetical protein V6x_51720 [Gimesia chilikensis]|uniref:Uncharacterized protein n=1 Tax=Gimesia chilikensis TaxID=2605989 RepID=A0A517WJK8_9PLAN|nr:hypothetical protein [Gimesia chilikensis]KAA0134445.1 hypothetical protein FYZ48_20340 [Gimesia chilikensis]QDU05435.1 hypothetical protein V6x_51720 [Gimesia chilikensis]
MMTTEQLLKTFLSTIVSLVPSILALYLVLKGRSEVSTSKKSGPQKKDAWLNTKLSESVLSGTDLLNVDKPLSRIVSNTYYQSLRKELFLLSISGFFPFILTFVKIALANPDLHNDSSKNIAFACLSPLGIIALIHFIITTKVLMIKDKDFYQKHKNNPPGAFKILARLNYVMLIVVALAAFIVNYVTLPYQENASTAIQIEQP